MAFSVNLIQEYLDGGELEGYDVNELEDNPAFMREAILASGDKKLYNLCSDKVKADYKFVDFLLTRFHFDFDFIDKAAEHFLEATEDEDDFIAIVVKMCNILKRAKQPDLFAKYRIIYMARFLANTVEIVAYFGAHPEDVENLGAGFFFMKDMYDFNEEVLKYFAVEFIRYIFEEKADLEYELHQDVKEPSEIQEMGVNNYMVRLLNRFDPTLADYAAIHPDILEDLRKEIAFYASKWHLYEDKQEAYDYQTMYSRVHDYFESLTDQGLIGEDSYIYYIGRELGISEKLAKFEGYTMEEYEAEYSDEDIDFIEEMLGNMQERIIYTNIKKIMENALFGRGEGLPQEGGKIIRVDFGKPRS